MSTPVYNQTPTAKYRPLARKDANSDVIIDSYGWTAFQGIYDVDNNLIYKGIARPGTATSATGWQISKLNYDVDGNLTSIVWPQDANAKASNDFLFIFTSYLSYTYS